MRGMGIYVVFTLINIRGMMKAYGYILLCCLGLLCGAVGKALAASMHGGGEYVTISGIVKDRSDKKALAYASVSVAGGTESTVANADGEFTFKVKAPLEGTDIEVSHLGYHTTRISLKGVSTRLLTVWLTPSSVLLDEVVVDGRGARQLVEEAVRKIPENYSDVPNRLTGFYRETARKRRRYINIAEAVVDMHKTPYSESAGRDRVRILKGRRLLSPKPSDTLAVKLLGGPTAAIYMDVVKNPDLLLSPEALPLYDFHWEEMVSIDRRLQYVISFRSNCVLPYALYHGKFYIDKERLAITRVEFFLDMSDRDKATQAILYRKPFRLRFKPVEVSYVVDYADYGGKSYLHYVRNEIHFRCDWKRKLFSTSYVVVSEMVVTDIKPAEANIPAREAFGRRQIFSDDASLFFDKDFWGHYNIIKPDESLEKAVGRLRKMHEEEPSSQKATADAAATLSESTP